MKIRTYINILSLLGGSLILGDDEFTVNVSKDCYKDNEDVHLIVQYTGTGSPIAVKWNFSKMINDAAALNVVLDFCVASAGADEAFPVDRMTYECDTVNNTYTVTISSFNETTDAGVWGASVSVDGAFTIFRNVDVVTCPAPAQGGGCGTGCIVGVLGLVPMICLIVGIIVWLFCFSGKNRKPTEQTESHAYNSGSGQTSSSRKIQDEHNEHGAKRSPQPPLPSGGENIYGREESVAAVSRADVVVHESDSYLL